MHEKEVRGGNYTGYKREEALYTNPTGYMQRVGELGS